jgi:glycosyltransferase involved in cell wall biosynthesis
MSRLADEETSGATGVRGRFVTPAVRDGGGGSLRTMSQTAAPGPMLRVVIVNPAHFHFTEQRATSIDLCVRDLVAFSRFKDQTLVIGEAVDDPFPGIAFDPHPVGPSDHFLLRRRALLALVRRRSPDVISVQEHLRTAAYLARHTDVPVLLHMHNPVRRPKAFFDRMLRARNYDALAGIVLVSPPLRDAFDAAWPSVGTPRHVVRTGLDMAAWQPRPERENVILVVGRAAPEKGIREAAEAMRRVLPSHPDWRTVFILTAVEAKPAYFDEVRETLGRLGTQAQLLVQQRFSVVKEWMECAAIVAVPSVWDEPFGRTALEAHAGGAAVVTSGTGGLADVSGDAALRLDRVAPETIAAAVEALIADPDRRARLGRAGRARAEAEFDVHRAAAAWDEIYASVARKRALRADRS